MGRAIILIANCRTGSSTLAGVIHTLGCNMGNKLLGKSTSNPKGHFEDIDFLEHNEKVVEDWTCPKLFANDQQIEIYKKIVESKDKQKIWGVKDPRLCITAKYVIPFCEDPRILTIERSIDSSVKSLCQRNNITKKEAREIIITYKNEKASIIRTFRSIPKFSVTYEDLINNKEDTIEEIINFVFDSSNKPTEDMKKKAIEFIDQKLNHCGF